MIDLSNGRGKVVVTWAQIIAWSTTLFGLGVVWHDVADLKQLVKAGIYSKADVDKMQAADFQRDIILAQAIDDLYSKRGPNEYPNKLAR